MRFLKTFWLTLTDAALIAGLLLVVSLPSSCNSNDDLNETLPDTIRFFAIGDFGIEGKVKQKEVADAMERIASEKHVDFILTLGDNFYPAGVSSVDDPKWKTSFEDVYNGPDLTNVPWYAALGDHDYMSDPAAEIAYSNVSQRWKMEDYHYTVTIPRSSVKLRLVVLDTNPFDEALYASAGSKLRDTTAQKHWMDSVFSLHDTDWTIVSGHHPMYTGGLRATSPNTVRESLLPLFAKHQLPVYFSGHEHDLQHLKADDLPLNQFISGAAAQIRPTGTISSTKFAASAYGFMSVEITRDAVDVYVISDGLDTLYQTRIGRVE